MDTTQSHTILIVSSELDVAQAGAGLESFTRSSTGSYLPAGGICWVRPEKRRSAREPLSSGTLPCTPRSKRSLSRLPACMPSRRDPNDEFAVWIAAWANDRWRAGLTSMWRPRFRDKKRMKQINAGIPTAREISMDAILPRKSDVSALVLIPRFLAAWVGVRIIHRCPATLPAVSIAAADKYRAHGTSINTFLKGYNPPPLYQIDAVVLQGRLAFLSVGEYIGKPIDYLNECPLGYLSVTDDHLQRFWRPFTAKILSAFDGPDGVYHIEAFGDAGEGAELLEIAFRPGSGSTIEMIQFAWGLNPDLGLVHLAAQLGLVGDVHFGRQAEAYGYMMFPKRHLAEETLYVTEVALPGIDRVPTLKMHKTRHRGDIASGEFYCHKDSLGVFVFSGDRSGVARDLKRIVEEYRVYAGPRQADC
uniref:ATP-grasp domain-containing protein n=1 Tax=Erwinia pyrifoliae TaxID=79967 RepID=Q3HY02_ERWPY|nr:unknown [Erwinia pyrifoliae]